jgi:hypothetical protein
MWSLIVVATATHYLTSFDACRPCHSGKCGFALAICALLFGPLLVIASFAYACATESRFFNGAFDACTNENGVRQLAHAVSWTAIVAPIGTSLFALTHSLGNACHYYVRLRQLRA